MSPRRKRYPDRRTYMREYRRRCTEREWQAKLRGRVTCPFRHGQGECGALLEHHLDELGRAIVVCPACERRKRGICRDCPRPVYGRVRSATRCAGCARRAVRDAQRACEVRNRDEKRRRQKELYRKSAKQKTASYLAKLEYKRAWRKANPEKVRAQKRRAALRQNQHVYEYHRKRRERERAELAARERQRYHGIVPPRTCVTPGCSTFVKGRQKKCESCKARDREIGAQLLAPRRGRGRRTDRGQAA